MKKTVRHPKFTAVLSTEDGYFSFTGDIEGWSGAVGDEIVKIYPELELAEKMHLAEIGTGKPMHAFANAEHFRREIEGKEDSEYEESELLAQLKSHLRCPDSMLQDYLNHAKGIEEELVDLWQDQWEELEDLIEDLEVNLTEEFIDPYVGNVLLTEYEEVLQEFEHPNEASALAKYLNVDVSLVEELGFTDFTYSYGGREYLCCEYKVAVAKAEDCIRNYVDDCVLSELPEIYRDFFDVERFVMTCLDTDGVAHNLSTYDGEENVSHYREIEYLIYRTN